MKAVNRHAIGKICSLLLLLVLLASCSDREKPISTGVPDPPFEGDPPEEPFVYKGEPGIYGGKIVLELWNDVRTLNIIRATDQNTSYLLAHHMFRCLVEYRSGEDPPVFETGLCSSFEHSPDLKEWTFKLRRGVRWSDGAPFTADDVLFSYNVIKDPKIDQAVLDIFIEGREESTRKAILPELTKIDDHTVKFTLHRPNASFLDAISNLWLIPAHKWEAVWKAGEFGEAMPTSADPKDIVGLGPFRLKEYVPGQRAVLERNPYFWKIDRNGNRLPYADQMIFVIAADFNTVMAKFQAEEIHMMSRVRAVEFALVEQLKGANVEVKDLGVSVDAQWLAVNMNPGISPATGKPYVEPHKLRLFRDVRFRKALSYGIDRQGIADTVYAGRAEPIYSFVTPADRVWYTSDVQTYPYEKELARQLLEEVGLRDGNNDSFLEDEDGRTIEFNIVTNSDNSQRVATMGFIVRNLREIGLKANSDAQSLNSIVDSLLSKFDWEVMVLGWNPSPPPGPTNTKNILLSSSLNHSCYPLQKTPSTAWEARIDELVTQIESTSDLNQRKSMFNEIQRIWSENLPEINLLAQREAVAYRKSYGNVKPSTLAPRLTWNAEEIYIKSQR